MLGSRSRRPLAFAFVASLALHVALAALIVARAAPHAWLAAGSAAHADDVVEVAVLRLDRSARSASLIPRPRVPLRREPPPLSVATTRPTTVAATGTSRHVGSSHAVVAFRKGPVAVSDAAALRDTAAQPSPRPAERPAGTPNAFHPSAGHGAIRTAVALAATPQATPPPSPVPSVAATSTAGARLLATTGLAVPPGPWGQTFERPLVADDEALAGLRARYHAMTVEVEVDDAGRATRIAIDGTLSDDDRSELERRLRDLRYVPAECNGLRCAGSLVIAL